jgi:transposase
MTTIDYIGFDVHKKTISFCIKGQDGRILKEGTIAAGRADLNAWAEAQARPWIGALEATLFTGWIYDHLRPFAQELKVANPAMWKAIAASKKKNDKVDARKIADLLRCDLLPECYRAPSGMRELRRVLRYRNLVVRQATRMKNRIAGLLMETGTAYNKQRLHGKAYFSELLGSLQAMPASVLQLLRLSRGQVELFEGIQQQLLKELRSHATLRERVERLQSIPGVGEVLALSWVLEIGEVQRFSSIAQAVSYCGLSSAQRSSAGKEQRGPRALTFASAIEEIARATGREIGYRTLTPEAYRAALLEAHVPDNVIDLILYLFTTVLDGRNEAGAEGVQRALGREPRDFSVYVERTAATGVWGA